MRKFKRKIGESYRPKFTKICYTGKGIQLEDGEGRVLRGKVFASEEEARAYATRMYGFCRNESTVKRRGKTMWKRINESKKKHVSKEEDNWYGIKDATFIYHGDYSDPEVEYKGVSLNYWAIQDGLWEVFKDENPEGTEKEFDKWMETHPEEVKSELELQYDAEIGNQDDELEEFDEGWLGDKMKAGWDAVKSGAKKVGKAIGDAFNGPFRKGDQIVMKGEDGESFKGTITDYSMSDKTYEVMLGKSVNEDWEGRGLEEEVLDMPDRVEELENEIEKLWVRLGDVDEGTVMKLIAAYVELEQIEPGRVDF